MAFSVAITHLLFWGFGCSKIIKKRKRESATNDMQSVLDARRIHYEIGFENIFASRSPHHSLVLESLREYLLHTHSINYISLWIYTHKAVVVVKIFCNINVFTGVNPPPLLNTETTQRNWATKYLENECQYFCFILCIFHVACTSSKKKLITFSCCTNNNKWGVYLYYSGMYCR